MLLVRGSEESEGAKIRVVKVRKVVSCRPALWRWKKDTKMKRVKDKKI